jgi:hypothetical protein
MASCLESPESSPRTSGPKIASTAALSPAFVATVRALTASSGDLKCSGDPEASPVSAWSGKTAPAAKKAKAPASRRNERTDRWEDFMVSVGSGWGSNSGPGSTIGWRGHNF